MALNDSIRAFDGVALAADAKEASHFSPLDGSISLAASDPSRSDRRSSDRPILPRDDCRADGAHLARRRNQRPDVLPGSIPFGPFIPPAN